jgi:glycosyltransferase involved in cell wall biosynthesis
MSYTVATIKELLKKNIEVHLVHWDEKKNTPYKIPPIDGLNEYKRSLFSEKELLNLSDTINPNLLVISGWQDNVYLTVARHQRRKNKIVVCAFDDQWHGTVRQYFAFLLGKFRFFSRYFSHAWVSGVYQFEYARKLGFKKNEIIYDLYSADLSIFKKSYKKTNFITNSRSCKFLYIGRFHSSKGLDVLISAWKKVYKKKLNWNLHLIGNGELKNKLINLKGVYVYDFMQPKSLLKEIAKTQCFILPSRKEPWGVVVHEMVAAGLPLILSNKVGSAKTFLIHNYNGFIFESENSESLASYMKKIMNMSYQNLKSMRNASLSLSRRITPCTSSRNLISLLETSQKS